MLTAALRTGTRTVLTRFGPVVLPGDSADLPEAEAALLAALLPPAGTAVDLGAEAGLHSLVLAQRAGPDGRVVAIEPQPALQALLRHNLPAALLGSPDGLDTIGRCDLLRIGGKTPVALLAAAAGLIQRCRPAIVAAGALDAMLAAWRAVKPGDYQTIHAAIEGTDGAAASLLLLTAADHGVTAPPGVILTPVATPEAFAERALALPQPGDGTPIDRDAGALRRRLSALGERCAGLEAQLAAQAQAVGSLATQLADSRAMIAALLSSTSWRVTAPLRALRGGGGIAAAPPAGDMPSIPMPPAALPPLPQPEPWRRWPIAPRAPGAPRVDVVIPVYGQRQFVLTCLAAVLGAAQTTPYELVVIDDASPDLEFRAELRHMAAAGLFTLVENPENLGFVATANRGLTLHPDRDVVLLNSDTAPCGDWLDRLRRAAESAVDIGTATPFSNNGSLCSYPHFPRGSGDPLELDDPLLDRLFATVNGGRVLPMLTGAGFCLYLRRACLDATGLFDVERFGRGYEEENDFCQRAAGLGWRHVLAADLFVRHFGGASFGAEREARSNRAFDLMQRLYPDYAPRVAAFLGADPIRPLRARIDLARLAERAGGRGAMLFVTHGRGGGTERHVQEMRALLEADGVPVFILRSRETAPGTLTLDTEGLDLPNLGAFDPADPEGFADLVALLGIRHLHLHHLIDLGPDIGDRMLAIARRFGLGYDYTAEDFLPACPRFNLTDGDGFYCGMPDEAGCRRCLDRNGSSYGAVDIATWRQGFGRLLDGARRVFVPCADVGRRLGRFFPDATYCERAHLTDFTAPRPGATAGRRIAVLGAIGPNKGSRILLAAAAEAARRGSPLHFAVVGYTDIDPQLTALPNVTITGRFREDEAQDQLAAQGCAFTWFPCVWPETYCYALNVTLEAGLYPVVFDLGSLGERVAGLGWGSVWPLDLARDAAALVDHLEAVEPTPPPPDLAARARRVYPDMLADYYGLGPALFAAG